jgi:hypothetical protein
MLAPRKLSERHVAPAAPCSLPQKNGEAHGLGRPFRAWTFFNRGDCPGLAPANFEVILDSQPAGMSFRDLFRLVFGVPVGHRAG